MHRPAVRRSASALTFLANPYVVLVDVLIATFFVMVLYLHAVRLHNIATTDPRVAQIKEFEKSLNQDIREFWGRRLQDEAESISGRGREPQVEPANQNWKEKQWWTTLPAETNVILKQDASSVKLILLGGTENTALFQRGTSTLTPRGEGLVNKLVRCLGESRAAYGLAENRAILSITIEGHTGDEGFASPAQSWDVSVKRALIVRERLERLGRTYDREFERQGQAKRPLFSPGRFSVVGRGHYLNLPYAAPGSALNRRVQVEVRLTSRFDDQR